jgi:hypothetical protein
MFELLEIIVKVTILILYWYVRVLFWILKGTIAVIEVIDRGLKNRHARKAGEAAQAAKLLQTDVEHVVIESGPVATLKPVVTESTREHVDALP